MKTNKTLVRFNIQNAKYALPASSGWAAPVSFDTSKQISLEADFTKKPIYGDGRKIGVIVNDKGKTGALTLNNILAQYEIDMKRKLRTNNGLADINQTADVPHCIYFETCGLGDDGSIPVAKTWLYMVSSTRPSESFDQNTDDINESQYEIPLEIRGLPVRYKNGTEYKNDKGHVIYAWQMTVEPDDAGYDTFGDAVVLPEMTNPTEG